MHIKFCGAALSVTGSCHLVSSGDYKVLLDCGQFQGSKAQEAMNFEPFPFNPGEIDFVVLSHAHIDHCGRLPLLVKRGFKGKIYCTDATGDLLEVMLRDSAYIHEKEAEWKNKKAERAGRDLVEALYTTADAENTFQYIKSVLYDQLVELNDKIKLVFNEAGHILGSAIVELWLEEDEQLTKLVYSGDIGVAGRPILKDPKKIKKADYVIMESTYGNRFHEENATSIDKLMEIVLKTTRRGGTVVIPSFAVGRTQELIFEFNKFFNDNENTMTELKDIMVYVDSPMAKNATDVFRNNAQVFDEETRNLIVSGDNPLDFKNLKFVKSSEESKLLNFNDKPKIIISASGMCEAGRIRHHLKHNLWNGKASVVFVGYQAEGTLGRNIVNGAERVMLFGEEIHVNAEIYNLEGFSGHADKNGLMDWVKGFQVEPKGFFLVHGEKEAKESLGESIRQEVGFDVTVINGVSEFKLENGPVITEEEFILSIADQEEMVGLKNKLGDLHFDLEKILYNTNLVFDDEMSPEKMLKLKNVVLELEKNAINLGSLASLKEEA